MHCMVHVRFKVVFIDSRKVSCFFIHVYCEKKCGFGREKTGMYEIVYIFGVFTEEKHFIERCSFATLVKQINIIFTKNKFCCFYMRVFYLNELEIGWRFYSYIIFDFQFSPTLLNEFWQNTTNYLQWKPDSIEMSD